MLVPQPFEKDYLTEEEIVSLVTRNGKYPLEKRMDTYHLVKGYMEINGSLKGLTLDQVTDAML